MYRTKHFRWKLMHIWGILSHLGLVIAAAIGFLYHLGTTGQSAPWGYPTAADVHSCGYPMMGRYEYGGGFTLDVAARTQLMTCFVVGSLGLAINVALFTLLLMVEPNRIMLTEGEQHWRKQVVTFFGCLLNTLLAAAGVGLAVTLGNKAADSKSLIAPLIWASIQAPLALTIAVCDAVKNYREGKDLLD